MRARLWTTGVWVATAALAAACWGPPAPDGAICRDMIHRLCLPVPCTVVTVTLGVGASCESDLLARTGCDAEDFAFPDPPGRDHFIQCRVPLLRAGVDPEQHPDCADVGDALVFCPDVTVFLGGVPP